MQSNINKIDPIDMGPLESKRELINFLVCQRRAARLVLRNVEGLVDSSMAEARLVKKYRASGNPILIRVRSCANRPPMVDKSLPTVLTGMFFLTIMKLCS